jgi:serine/threonine protein kinase
MGEVYRARDTKLDRDVAIKILPAAFASDAGRMVRFEREAKVLASLSSTSETANAEPAGMDADITGPISQNAVQELDATSPTCREKTGCGKTVLGFPMKARNMPDVSFAAFANYP